VAEPSQITAQPDAHRLVSCTSACGVLVPIPLAVPLDAFEDS
jgi:hypothetical protein